MPIIKLINLPQYSHQSYDGQHVLAGLHFREQHLSEVSIDDNHTDFIFDIDKIFEDVYSLNNIIKRIKKKKLSDRLSAASSTQAIPPPTPTFKRYSTEEPLYIGDRQNQLLNAVLYAYNMHRGLQLSPDVILHCISTAVAKCVQDHAEKYRDVFVNHADKATLTVETSGEFNWESVIRDMNTLIDKNVKCELDIMPTFTTTTPIATTVATITKMATLKKYFNYEMIFQCGITAVDLTGTLEDWQLLRTKVVSISAVITKKKHMVNWFKHVIKIIDRLNDTYQEKPDIHDFWSRIVNFVLYGSGGQTFISGWIKVLMPNNKYDEFPETLDMLEDNSKMPTQESSGRNWHSLLYKWAKDLTYSESSSCNVIDCKLNCYGVEYDLRAMAGVVGSRIVDDFVIPELGYIVRAEPTDRIRNEIMANLLPKDLFDQIEEMEIENGEAAKEHLDLNRRIATQERQIKVLNEYEQMIRDRKHN